MFRIDKDQATDTMAALSAAAESHTQAAVELHQRALGIEKLAATWSMSTRRDVARIADAVDFAATMVGYVAVGVLLFLVWKTRPTDE